MNPWCLDCFGWFLSIVKCPSILPLLSNSFSHVFYLFLKTSRIDFIDIIFFNIPWNTFTLGNDFFIAFTLCYLWLLTTIIGFKMLFIRWHCLKLMFWWQPHIHHWLSQTPSCGCYTIVTLDIVVIFLLIIKWRLG